MNWCLYQSEIPRRKQRGFAARAALPGLFFLAWILMARTAFGLDTANARWPMASGDRVETSGKLMLDISNDSEGYFMASAPEGSTNRLKLRVEKDGMTLTYDLNGEGEYEVFPLQLGSGTYTISLYENVGAKKYAMAGGYTMDVTLGSDHAVYLYPNQYIHYTELSPLLEKAQELGSGQDEKGTFDSVCAFMGSDFVYDFIKSLTVSAGVLPDVDGTYDQRMGICQDLSAVMVSILRSLGVPSRMVIGYADDNYHAWTQTMIGEEELFFDPTAAVGGLGSVKDYSMERYY